MVKRNKDVDVIISPSYLWCDIRKDEKRPKKCPYNICEKCLTIKKGMPCTFIGSAPLNEFEIGGYFTQLSIMEILLFKYIKVLKLFKEWLRHD